MSSKWWIKFDYALGWFLLLTLIKQVHTIDELITKIILIESVFGKTVYWKMELECEEAICARRNWIRFSVWIVLFVWKFTFILNFYIIFLFLLSENKQEKKTFFFLNFCCWFLFICSFIHFVMSPRLSYVQNKSTSLRWFRKQTNSVSVSVMVVG